MVVLGPIDAGDALSLNFPNVARNYDATRDCIHFTGHDGVFEIDFAVATAALPPRVRPIGDVETDFLLAFDDYRLTVHNVARELYRKHPRKRYMLTSFDFR